MRLSFRLKHHFFSAFREIFVHHHGSLEFRAKIFALLIAADDDTKVESYIIVKDLALEIYKNDEDRANLLMLTTKELVNKVKEDNGLDIDTLIQNIQKELRTVPRYAKKIDTQSMLAIIDLSHDLDTKSYQNHILDFLNTLKSETLHEKKVQIKEDEKKLLAG